MGRHPFVVLEGVDGTGKTSVAKRVATRIGGQFVKTPPSELSSVRQFFDTCGSLEARYAHYLSGVLLASSRISEMLEETPVVCDRYIYTTMAYHSAMGLVVDWVDHDALPILHPDYCFCLTASEEVIRTRLAERDGQASVIDRSANAMLMQRVAEQLKQMATHTMDTSNLSVDEVAARICQMIS